LGFNFRVFRRKNISRTARRTSKGE